MKPPPNEGMKTVEKRLAIDVTLPNGQELSVWVWEEKDRKRARDTALFIANAHEQSAELEEVRRSLTEVYRRLGPVSGRRTW